VRFRPRSSGLLVPEEAEPSMPPATRGGQRTGVAGVDIDSGSVDFSKVVVLSERAPWGMRNELGEWPHEALRRQARQRAAPSGPRTKCAIVEQPPSETEFRATRGGKVLRLSQPPGKRRTPAAGGACPGLALAARASPP
jgi:hypothetical protein